MGGAKARGFGFSAAATDLNDTGWRSLEGSIAWYRKRFAIPYDCGDKRIYLFFDGVYRNSTVYLNEYFVGTHSGAFFTNEPCALGRNPQDFQE